MQYLNPVFWLRSISRFVYAWILTVHWGELARAVPALLLLLLGSVLAGIAYSDGSSWRMKLLDLQLKSAYELEDYPTAELVVRRQLERRPTDADLAFSLASIQAAQNKQEAVEMMRRLASVNRSQKAARWLLEKDYDGKSWNGLSAEQKREFGDLLAFIAKESPDDLSIKASQVDYFLASGRYQDAVPLLVDLAEVQPMRGLQAAALSKQLGQAQQADRLAEKVLGKMSALLTKDPTNAALILAVCRTQLFLERYPDVVRNLQQGLKVVQKDEERVALGSALGDALVAWIDSMQKQGVETKEERVRVLKMLQVALQYAPKNPRVLSLVVDQIMLSALEDDEQIEAIRSALVSGTSTGIAHFIRGTSALIKEDYEAATTSLTLASEQLPLSGAILNNLAVSMSLQDESKLEDALKLSEKAIEITESPVPSFYETRGQLLFRLGRYMQAVPDLERALAEDSLKAEAHRSLAVCYEEMGEPEIAAGHAKAADQAEASDEG